MAERLSIIIEVDSRIGEAAIARINRAFSTMGGSISRIALSGARGLDRMAGAFTRAAVASQGIQLAMAGVGAGVGAAFTAAAKQAIGLSSSLETARMAFDVMTGSAQKSATVIRSLYRFAIETPFTFTGLVEQSKLLVAYGFDISRVIPMLRAMGDAAAALGQEKLPFITRALGQIQAKGRVQAQELLQLQETGINATKILAEAAGKSTAQMLKAIESGAVPAQQAITALLAGISKQFGGLMAKQAQTVLGVLSNLKDRIQMSMTEVGAAISPTVIKIVKALTPAVGLIGELAKKFQMLPGPVRDAAVALGLFTAALIPISLVGPTLLGIVAPALRVGSALTKLAVGGAAARAAATGWAATLVRIGPIAARFAGWIGIVVAALAALKWALGKSGSDIAAAEWSRLGRIASGVSANLKSLWQSVKAVTGEVAGLFGVLGGGRGLMESFGRDVINKMLEPLHMLLDVIEKVNEGLAYILGNSGGVIEKAAQANIDRINKNTAEAARKQAELAGAAAGKPLTLREAMDQAAADVLKAAAAKKAETAAKSAAKAAAAAALEAEKRAATELRNATVLHLAKVQEFEGTSRLVIQYLELRGELGKTAQARRDLAAAFQIRIQDAAGDELRRNARAAADELADANEKRRERDARMLSEATGFSDDAAKLANETDARRIDAIKDNIDRERELRLIALEGMGQDTVSQQIGVEQRRLAIELDYIDRKALAEIDSIKRTHELELTLYRARAEVMLNMGVLTQGQFDAAIDAQIRAATQTTTEIVEKSEADKVALQQRSAVQQEQIARDHTKRVFESFKQQAGGVFDALLQKSTSVWAAMGNAFKVAMLTAIKDVVTSRVAQMLTQMVGGGTVGFSGGRGGVGSTPGFGGALGSVAAVGSAGGLGGLRTPPFVGGAATGSGGSGAGGFGGFAGLGGLAGNLREFAGLGESISTGAGTATTFGAASLAQKLGSLAKSDAAALGGAMLAFRGISKGGLSGTLQAGAGGALVGFKYGGPIGAVIGGAVGAGSAVLRTLFGGKSGEEKMREAIKSVWRVDVTDKGVLKQLAEMAQQTFGGNYELAARSPAVREIVEQFAAMTGQRSSGFTPKTLASAELAQRGGITYQVGTNVNGQQYGYSSPLPSMGGLETIQSASQMGRGAVVLQLDAEATQDLLAGNAVEAMAQNPRAVAQASVRAFSSSFGRRRAGAALYEPLTVTP